jgi:hypothetical protein
MPHLRHKISRLLCNGVLDICEISWMEIISGNKMCVLTVDESNAKKGAIVIAIGIRATSEISMHDSRLCYDSMS